MYVPGCNAKGCLDPSTQDAPLITACPARRAPGSVQPTRFAWACALHLALVVAPLASSAQAQTWGGALGASSENIYRGIGQSRGDPSVFADLHVGLGGNWLLGINAASVHPQDRPADSQFSLYADRRWRFGTDWSAKLGFVHYDSLHSENHDGLRYDELNAAIAWRGRWVSTLAWSPRVNNAYLDVISDDVAWLWAETAWHQPIGDHLSLDAGIGFGHPVHAPPHDYHYANLGVTFAVASASLSVGRIWASERKYSYELFNFPYELTLPSRQRWVASVMWLF